IFEPEKLDLWLEELYKRNILDKVYILAGVSPIKSLKMAQHLQNCVPGVFVPETVIKRFENCKPEDYGKLGFDIAMEIINGIKGKQGLNGLHLMSVGWEAIVPAIVQNTLET
ncbi:MAG: methylenetetrahydrofolate reductase, partial [Bacteroidales bacterium]|nr:methylenetetrahydrofolate reductase [Bacteroidales bacterium]